MAKSSKLIAELVGRLRPIMDFQPVEVSETYTIGQLSAHLGVSLRTLRFYEQSGLLAPSREGLRRLYSHDDLERLEVIVILRELEVSLTAIKVLMATIDADGRTSERDVYVQTETLLAELSADNRTRIDELERINARIAEARSSLVAG
jgi:DNA-binding transcriptional MerR regulator